jgi:uncharacterized protein
MNQLAAKPWFRSLLYLAVSYGGLVLMLVFLENRLVYHPYSADASWIAKPIADIQDVDLKSADGTRLHAWWCPAADSDQAILYFHGNAGNLSWRGGSIVKLRNHLKISVLIVDYPGYGKSEGAPTEQGCYQAADAAYDWLTAEKKIAPRKISLYGASLGGGVAVDLASRKEHRALILIKTFTSLPDAASHLYWWLPVPKKALMTNRFDSLSKIGRCQGPVFIAHGTADTLIPYWQGEQLFEAAHEPKRFLPMPGKDHNDELPAEFFASLREFMLDTDPK